jgi:hypothetical protein
VNVQVEESRARSNRPATARRFRGPAVALGLCFFIVLTAIIAWSIHLQNLRARQQIRDAIEAAERLRQPPSP